MVDMQVSSMTDEFLLLNPGPVPLSAGVRRALDDQMVSHRSKAFETTYERAQTGLDYIFTQSTLDDSQTGSTGGTSLILNGTATMGMEAAIANTVTRDSEVVPLVNGKFGRRFKRIADRHATVSPVETEWGASFDIADVADAVSGGTDIVTMVHNETSTGLLNPVAEVGAIAHDHDALFIVDGVTSIGGDEFCIDEWHVDIAITDAQKALAAPPGISAMYLTDRAKTWIAGESAPFYEDLDWHLRKADSHQTPFTSAVPLFRALAVAVDEIREEGMSNRIHRHRRQAQAFRAGFTAFGLDRFPDPSGPTELSNTVTAIALPEEVQQNPEGFFDAVAERNVSISGGQAHLGGEIFRVSNMGNLAADQIVRGVRVIGEALNDVGVPVKTADGAAAASDTLSNET